MHSWSLNFYIKYKHLLTIPSLLRFWRAARAEKKAELNYHSALQLKLKQPYGCRITLRPMSNDYYTLQEIFIEQVYAATVKMLDDVKYVIDAGANIGLATIYFSAYWPNMKVICVEPDEANARLLMSNTEHMSGSQHRNVRIGALWGTTGEVVLGCQQMGHVNQFSCHDVSDDFEEKQSKATAWSIPDLMDDCNFPRVDLLKLDVEGAEVNIFKGNVDWLDRVNAIAIEFHGASREESKFDKLMAEYNYAIIHNSGHTVLALKCKG